MANEILASLDDINVHLPDDKAKMRDSDDNELQVDIARYVKSLLSGFVDSATLGSWSSPSNTPDLIRGIAGRLIASKWYAVLYSEDIPEGNTYAQNLYNEANMMIDNVRAGKMVLLDSSGDPVVVSGTSLDSTDFWPNDSTGDPKFSMDMTFG